jgi:hypothetical protein
MKGYSEIQLLGMIVLTIGVIGFIAVLTTGGQTSAEAPQSLQSTCTTSNDCKNSQYGMVCMSINGESYSCGCLTDSDCPGTAKCIDNKCR